MYFVELVWNREFDWCSYGGKHDTIESAIKSAESIQNSGDGERVKKTRIIDGEGKVVWAYGKLVAQ